MKAVLHGAIIAIALFAGISAEATQRAREQDTGSHIRKARPARIPTQMSIDPVDRGRLATADFARCMVDRDRARVENLLVQSPDVAWEKKLASLASADCLWEGEFRYSPMLLRGALFAELWNRREAGVATAVRFAETFPAYEEIDLGEADSVAKQHAWLMWFAGCVVSADRDGVRSIIAAQPGSRDQNMAYAKVIPKLPQCLVGGERFTFSKPVFESAVAEALFHPVVSDEESAGNQ